jgi:hypothetical protein
MNNTPDSPAKPPDDRTDKGGNYWTLFTPGTWKVLHAVLQTYGLRTAWRDGEVRPTNRPKQKAPRGRRRPDPFVTVTARVREWFEAEPWRTSRELFERLQAEQPDAFPDRQRRTLQRRLKEWRREMAHKLVFGVEVAGATTHQAPGSVHPEASLSGQGLVT